MNLLSVQSQGAVWLTVLFLLCVILVHGAKLAKIGYRTLHKKLPPAKPAPKPQPKPEPVYFLVERKKTRRTKTKTEYTPPKEIKFR